VEGTLEKKKKKKGQSGDKRMGRKPQTIIRISPPKNVWRMKGRLSLG